MKTHVRENANDPQSREQVALGAATVPSSVLEGSIRTAVAGAALALAGLAQQQLTNGQQTVTQLILSVGSAVVFGLAVPTGCIPPFQFVAVTVLVPFGCAHSQALAYIISYQAIIYVVVLVWGPIGLWRLNGWSRSTFRVSLEEFLPTMSEMPAHEEGQRTGTRPT